jgi:hypothetical protein
VSVAPFYQTEYFFSPENGFVPLDFVHSSSSRRSSAFIGRSADRIVFFSPRRIAASDREHVDLWIFGSALESCDRTCAVSGFLPFLRNCRHARSGGEQSTFDNTYCRCQAAQLQERWVMYLILRPFSKIIFGVFPFISFRIPAFVFLLFWFWMQWKSIGVERQGTLVAWWATQEALSAEWLSLSRLKKNFKERDAKKRSAGKGLKCGVKYDYRQCPCFLAVFIGN